MKETYDIHNIWVSYELHPETPAAGILLAERFKGHDIARMYEPLRERGKEFGIVFGYYTLLSNSRLALEASEYARDMGKYEIFHGHIFHAYFTEALDIGSLEVLATIAARCDLDAGEMMKALAEKRYSPRLAQAREEGKKINLTGVPTFIINEQHTIVGAQSVKVFQSLLRKISEEKTGRDTKFPVAM